MLLPSPLAGCSELTGDFTKASRTIAIRVPMRYSQYGPVKNHSMYSMNLTSPDDFVDSIRGMSIEGGEVNEDGLHLYLSDGRVLIILGIVYVGQLEKGTLQ